MITLKQLLLLFCENKIFFKLSVTYRPHKGKGSGPPTQGLGGPGGAGGSLSPLPALRQKFYGFVVVEAEILGEFL